MPNGVKVGEPGREVWGFARAEEYLEVNGVDQHQDSELIDDIRGNDVGDTPFGLVGYPLVDGHSGQLRIFLGRTENEPARCAA